jgi:hypothetical protein
MPWVDVVRLCACVCVCAFGHGQGYLAALECNGMELEQQRLKVEKCKSAGPKGRAAQLAASRQQPAPKARSRPLWQSTPPVSCSPPPPPSP